MEIYNIDSENVKHVAQFMTVIRPIWWPSKQDAMEQLTEINASIKSVGWYIGEDEKNPIGWIFCRELLSYRTLELECCGYNDNGVFALEHKLNELFDVAVKYAKANGYLTFRTGMGSREFNIHNRPLGDIADEIKNLKADERIDYHFLLNYGFKIIGIQPNVYDKNFHMIVLGLDLTQ